MNTIFTIIKPNVTPTIFEIILKYIYTGEFNFKNKSGTDNFKLLVTCSNLILEELIEYLQSFLNEQYSSWIRQNFVLIRPYKAIIPINLYNEILEYHLVIKPKLLGLKDPIYIRNENDPIYKFKLIYHSKPNEIHSNNDNNNNTFNGVSFANLILIKTKGSNTKNFGGYDNEHIQNIKISRIKPFSITEFLQDLCTSTYKIKEIEAYSVTKFI
ncbi:hypothetical protein C1646_751993 [Rhizophagus diaphanus]|nr:hypothetical protein C1646_751993 [Rhizophagus diaphanus] [Rhizophagus sp. MUCL 43196]